MTAGVVVKTGDGVGAGVTVGAPNVTVITAAAVLLLSSSQSV
jgi:hypothetical protein